MPRKSAAALETITPAGPVRRPDPPADATELEAVHWRTVVGRMSPDWFPAETHGILLQYCRHLVRAGQLARMLEAAEKDPKEFRELLKLEQHQTAAIATLATKMRLTQLSDNDRDKKKPKQAEKPWERRGRKPWKASTASLGDEVIEWIEDVCRVPEGRDIGKPLVLRGWQRDEIRKIYDNPAGTRRALISFGRKNAKSTLSACLLLVHLVGPLARVNSQLYSTAQSREQAAVIFNLAAKIVRMSPDLRDFVNIRDTAKQLFCPELGTLYRALSAEVATSFGLSPVLRIDEAWVRAMFGVSVPYSRVRRMAFRPRLTGVAYAYALARSAGSSAAPRHWNSIVDRVADVGAFQRGERRTAFH
jgi:hypothetical protein